MEHDFLEHFSEGGFGENVMPPNVGQVYVKLYTVIERASPFSSIPHCNGSCYRTCKLDVIHVNLDMSTPLVRLGSQQIYCRTTRE